MPLDDGLLFEPTTEVNGNDPSCKRVKRSRSQEDEDFLLKFELKGQGHCAFVTLKVKVIVHLSL